MCDISFCMQLSPYNYERIEAVLQILQAADENVTSFSVVQVRKEALFSFSWRIVLQIYTAPSIVCCSTGNGPPSAS